MTRPTRDDERAIERLLGAAAARPDELPRPSPFLARRVAALARERGGRPGDHPIGAAAFRLLPAFSLLLAVVAALAGREAALARKERDEAVARLIEPGGGDLLLAAALLGASEAPAPRGGRP